MPSAKAAAMAAASTAKATAMAAATSTESTTPAAAAASPATTSERVAGDSGAADGQSGNQHHSLMQSESLHQDHLSVG
jgi:hypothetical protein